ncbi:signal peptidase I [Halobellus marinus]|uniref:signal peptidase I n=1 Tax=Halobellus TaxID=1073986 RepID=UPI0028A6F124|nr:signal peptidase I [Halobellus sp. DFY28]
MIQLPTLSLPSAGQLLVTLVLLAAISPFVVFAVPQVVGADDGFVVLSGSMEPALSPGDVVIVDASGPVEVGDVITYRTGADTVPTTHRVVGVVDGGYETKGDANENADAGLVGPGAIIGRTILVIPLVGHVILWVNTPVGYVTLVVAPLVLFGISELFAWARREPEATTTGPETARSDSGADAPDEAVEVSSSDASEVVSDAGATAGTVGEATAPQSAETVAVAAVDLKLTLLAMAALLAYAGWNVYREFTVAAAPDPVSVGALTGGLLGLLFAGSVTVAAWRATKSAAGTPPPLALTDGRGDVEVGDE